MAAARAPQVAEAPVLSTGPSRLGQDRRRGADHIAVLMAR